MQDTSKTSETFRQEDVKELLLQMSASLCVLLEHSAEEWAAAIMGATDGLKGLSGAVLRQVWLSIAYVSHVLI